MNFFEQQEQARRLSHVLVLLFLLTVLLVVALVDVIVLFILFLLHNDMNWSMAIWVSIVTLGFIGGASLQRTFQLRSRGGSDVAEKLGATLIAADTDDFVLRRLRNVTEEMAIACNTPVPDLYVMGQEGGINAFSSGYGASDAIICVTRGCLDNLTRGELQGIVAHEFSHILNGDVRLNIRLIGLLHGILVISTIGRMLMAGNRTSTQGWRDGFGRPNIFARGGSVGIGAAFLAIGSIGLFFARMIQAAVTRSREKLADAAALQFTRQPAGLGGALKKILALPLGSMIRSPNRQEVSHMLFSKGMPGALLATHPPLAQRIRLLDPGFTTKELEFIRKTYIARQDKMDRRRDLQELTLGSSPLVVAMATEALSAEDLSPFASDRAQPDRRAGTGNGARRTAEAVGLVPALSAASQSLRSAKRPAGKTIEIDADRLAQSVARPNAEHVQAARDLLEQIPAALCEATRNQNFASAVIFALVLDTGNAATTKHQLAALDRPDTVAVAGKVQSLHSAIAALQPSLRLPLAAMAFPCLRRLPKSRLRVFNEQLEELVKADNAFGFEEYCLTRLVQAQVVEAVRPGAGRGGLQSLENCTGEIRDLLSLVAGFGNHDPEQARSACTKAAGEVLPSSALDYSFPSPWRSALNKALYKLDRLRPADKERLVRGLTLAVNDDGVVTVREAELLRTICAVLHCPLPPFLQSAEPG